MRRCVIWGAGEEYERILNQVKYEELKGNLECVAVLSKTASQFAREKDGYRLIGKEDLRDIAFDYLIVAAERSYGEIKREAVSLGISEQRIISSRVLKVPGFDFKSYASLRENPITILSDDCWGGYVYHELDLPFASPLINIYWPSESFYEFMKDPFFYLEQPLRMEREGDPRKNLFPIGWLGDDNRRVELHFVHESDFQKAEGQWNRRKARINRERVFVKFGFDGTDPRREAYLAAFDQVPYNKMCTYSGETDVKDVLYIKRFEWDWYHLQRIEIVGFKDWFRQPQNFFKVVDVFKLLNGERDYVRER